MLQQYDFRKTSLGQRIVATIAYFDVFKKRLSEKELVRLLLGSSKSFSGNQLRIEILKLSSLIKQTDQKFHLLQSTPTSQFDSSYLIEKAKNKSWVFKHVPFVKMVAICNYLPLGIADDQSDIDLLIITDLNRIFLARSFATFILQLFSLRRHGKKVKSRFCLSFYANEYFLNFDDLILEKDIYFAFWLQSLLPLYGDKKVWQNIYSENQEWLKFYFDSDRRPQFDGKEEKSIFKFLLEKLLSGSFGNFLEMKLGSFFVKRNEVKSKNLGPNASIVVNSRRLKFHNNDRRNAFREAFEEKLKWLGFFE